MSLNGLGTLRADFPIIDQLQDMRSKLDALELEDGRPRRKCAYCARFGSGETCQGCGAPIDWSDRPLDTRPFVDIPLGRVTR